MSVVIQVEQLSKYYRLGLIGGGTLNGTILGMTRPEVTCKLDEIVEFAEMAQFIDTQVKNYSSVMTLRVRMNADLHLEPEILIIDEVLAVGDAMFQQKCHPRKDHVFS